MIDQAEKAVKVRIVRSDGRIWECGTGTDWRIPKDGLEDWGVLEYQVKTAPNVMRHGSSVVSRRVAEKDRTLEAVYAGREPSAARARAIAFFNADYEFAAYVTYMGRTRWCEGVQAGFAPSTSNVYEHPKITWTLLCPDPYMRDVSGNEQSFGDSVARIGFPFVSHLRKPTATGVRYPAGTVASTLVFDGKNTVWNGGDHPTRYRVVIEADGELVNPCIEKGGKFVRVLLTMKAGDVLIIDFEASPTPTVTLNGRNVIAKSDRRSTFGGMEMQVGANVFTFTIDNMENRSLARVQVRFYAKHTAV